MPFDGPTLNIGGYQCKQLSIEGSRNRDGRYLDRVLRCYWQDAEGLSDYLAGGPRLVGDTVVNEQAKSLPGFDRLFASSISIKGVGEITQDDDELIAYEFADLTVRYSTIDFSFDTQDLSIIDIDYGQQVFAPPAGSLVFHDTLVTGHEGEIVPSPPPIIISLQTITIVRRNLPLPSSTDFSISSGSTLGTFAGRGFAPRLYRLAAAAPLNSDPVPALDVEAPKLSMFGGARSQRRVSTAGTFVDVAMQFKVRPIQWDRGFALNGETPTIVRNDGSNTPLLETSDQNLLLK